jgi:hypothetical protein
VQQETSYCSTGKLKAIVTKLYQLIFFCIVNCMLSQYMSYIKYTAAHSA